VRTAHPEQGWQRYTEVARLALASGDTVNADRALSEAVNAAEALPDGAIHAAVALTNLAQLRQRQDRHAEAVPLLTRALALRDEAFGSDHPSSVRTAVLLAEAYEACGASEDALPLLARTAQALEQRRQTVSEELTSNLSTLSGIYRRRGDHARAESALRQLLAVLRPLPPDDPAIIVALADLADTLQRLERPAEAERLWRRVAELRERSDDLDAAALGIAYERIADCRAMLGRRAEAPVARGRAGGGRRGRRDADDVRQQLPHTVALPTQGMLMIVRGDGMTDPTAPPTPWWRRWAVAGTAAAMVGGLLLGRRGKAD
jgi:tetratricopeptide (TPR) repeat protein